MEQEVVGHLETLLQVGVRWSYIIAGVVNFSNSGIIDLRGTNALTNAGGGGGGSIVISADEFINQNGSVLNNGGYGDGGTFFSLGCNDGGDGNILIIEH